MQYSLMFRYEKRDGKFIPEINKVILIVTTGKHAGDSSITGLNRAITLSLELDSIESFLTAIASGDVKLTDIIF
ncbi:hypothetical protein [Nostoc sp. LPT]|uniref:hypothetical protein n=1 Tax=Nostoc sp. LPT TaxID=2815387 RepID=UPI0025DA816A|nr:hypothetical protein [Nostoc sp. LPT]